MNKLNKILCKLRAKWKDMIDTILTGSCGCIRTVTFVWNLPEWEECEGCKQAIFSEDLEIAVFFKDHGYNYRYGMNISEGMCNLLFLLVNKEKVESAAYFIIDGHKYEKYAQIVPVGFGAGFDYYQILLKKC